MVMVTVISIVLGMNRPQELLKETKEIENQRENRDHPDLFRSAKILRRVLET